MPQKTKKRKKRVTKETFRDRKRRLKRRMFWVKFFFVGGLVFLFGRISYFKFVKGDDFEKKVLQRMSSTEREVEALRGNILDRNHKTIATSMLAYHIILDPSVILDGDKPEDQERRAHTYKVLAEYAGTTASQVQKIVEENKTKKYRIFKKTIPAEDVEMLKDQELKGVWFEETFMRQYPKNVFASQLIGFYNKSYGQYGVEQYYNEYLTGTPGRIFPQLQEGNIITTQVLPPESGDTLVLTLDEVIQQYVEQTMDRYVKEYKPLNAAAIVMNPKTGEIYSMYSYPTFDPNAYTNLKDVVGSDIWDAATGKEQTAMLNHAWKNFNIQNPYEPGSTFKPLVVAAGLEEGLIDPDTLYTCNGRIKIADTTIGCWKPGGHGTQTLQQALANSCNPAIIQMSEKIPREVFSEYFKKYGIGELTHVDLPGEAQGMTHSLQGLGPVEKATSSMGQTFTTTPLQLITAFSSIINGGYLMQPYTVSQIIDGNGKIVFEQEPKIKRQVISEEVSASMRNYLETVVSQGTGINASIDGYRIGGKTGTAEKLPREEGEYIISFMGFAPVDDPEVIALILFDEVEEKSGIPTKAFKEMMQNILPYLEIESDLNYETPDAALSVIPEVRNKTLMEAIGYVNSENLSYEVIGVGSKVVDQYPEAGSKRQPGTAVKLYVETDHPENIVTIPDLNNKTVAEAQAMVGTDFNIVYSGNMESKITTQAPYAGVKVEKGHEIIVQTVE